MFWNKKPPSPPKKTVEDSMKELVRHEQFRKTALMQVHWLHDAEWQFTPQGLCVSPEIYPHAANIYQGVRRLNEETTISNSALSALKKENAILKADNARLRKELESIAPKPLGRKLIVTETETEKKETTQS